MLDLGPDHLSFRSLNMIFGGLFISSVLFIIAQALILPIMLASAFFFVYLYVNLLTSIVGKDNYLSALDNKHAIIKMSQYQCIAGISELLVIPKDRRDLIELCENIIIQSKHYDTIISEQIHTLIQNGCLKLITPFIINNPNYSWEQIYNNEVSIDRSLLQTAIRYNQPNIIDLLMDNGAKQTRIVMKEYVIKDDVGKLRDALSENDGFDVNASWFLGKEEFTLVG